MDTPDRPEAPRSPQKAILALSQPSNNGDGSNLTPRSEQEGESLLQVRPNVYFFFEAVFFSLSRRFVSSCVGPAHFWPNVVPNAILSCFYSYGGSVAGANRSLSFSVAAAALHDNEARFAA